MSNNPQVLPPTESQALALRPLPAELLNRFDQFLITALDKIAESESALAAVRDLPVETEAEFIVADVMLANLKKTNKALEDERLTLTRPIDDFKAQFLSAIAPAHKNYAEAMMALTSEKMSPFRAKKRAESEAAQRKAEQELAERKAHEEAEARKLEERAAKLKTPARAEALMREADAIRQASEMMPESVALAAAAPQTVASNVAEIHYPEINEMSEFLRWLADHPEWHCCFTFKNTKGEWRADMLRLAKQFHATGIPGLKFGTRDSFRSKPGRR